MAKSKNKSSQQIKSDVARLKRLGLYSGDLRRKEPTRYAKELTKKFSDVLNGKAQVVSVPKVATKKNKGVKAARDTANELAAQFGETMRAKSGKVIVKTAVAEEKAVFLPSRKTIVTRYKEKSGRVITHEYIRPGERLPELQAGETYSLPFARGKNGVDYVMRASEDEILALANQYESKADNPYKGASGHIQLAYVGKKRAPRKTLKPRTAAGDNVIDLNSRRKK